MCSILLGGGSGGVSGSDDGTCINPRLLEAGIQTPDEIRSDRGNRSNCAALVSKCVTPCSVMRLLLSHLSRAAPRRSFASSAQNRMKVVPVPVRSDNYAYLLIDDNANKALAVDAYDVPKVKAAAQKEGVELVGKLTTHHHHDHSGGNEVCDPSRLSISHPS